MRITRSLLWIFPLSFLLSCSQAGRPAGILDEDKMQSVLTDVLIAEARLSMNSLPGDTFRRETEKIYGEVFKKQGISREQFIKNMDYYGRHPDVMDKKFEGIIDSLNELEARTR